MTPATGRPAHAAARPTRYRRRSRAWWAVAAVLLMVAAGCLTAGVRDRTALAGPVPETYAPPPAAARSPAVPGVPAPAESLGAIVARVPPVALRIPVVGVDVRLTELGLNPDRTVEVPTDFALPGWYRLGPAPGQRGSAVILGHVDSYRGPAVFFRLRALRVGDGIEVGLADGTVARFAVRAVETYLKRDFPAQRVYGDHGGRSLQLVTCGGEFDRTARSYRSNVVVYTELVSASG